MNIINNIDYKNQQVILAEEGAQCRSRPRYVLVHALASPSLSGALPENKPHPTNQYTYKALGMLPSNYLPSNSGKSIYNKTDLNGVMKNKAFPLNLHTYTENQKEEILGVSNSSVRRAHCKELGYVAIKSTFIKSQCLKYSHEVLAHMLMEGHPNVVQLLDIKNEGETAELVLEQMDIDLDEIWNIRSMKPEEVRKLAEDVLKGLSHMHSKGIVHRDLKGGNIMVKIHDGELEEITDLSKRREKVKQLLESGKDLEMTFKIGDFGSVTIVGSDNSNEAGTVSFLSPEALLSSPGSGQEKQDLWALGCTILEVLMEYNYFEHDYPEYADDDNIPKLEQLRKILSIVGMPTAAEFENIKASLKKWDYSDRNQPEGGSPFSASSQHDDIEEIIKDYPSFEAYFNNPAPTGEAYHPLYPEKSGYLDTNLGDLVGEDPHSPKWGNIIALILRLLKIDPTERPTSEDCLAWWSTELDVVGGIGRLSLGSSLKRKIRPRVRWTLADHSRNEWYWPETLKREKGDGESSSSRRRMNGHIHRLERRREQMFQEGMRTEDFGDVGHQLRWKIGLMDFLHEDGRAEDGSVLKTKRVEDWLMRSDFSSGEIFSPTC